MRYVLLAPTVAAMMLVFTTSAPAQNYGVHYNTPNVYCPPNYPVSPAYGYAQPQYAGSFNYSTPGLSFGLGYNQGYGSNYGIYTQPRYVPNYYQSPPISSWQGQYHPQHHHHGHR